MEKASTLSPPSPTPPVPSDRLESWKEIGTYLNRDVRTVQRWEQTKGLPVRRLPGGDMARVYALKSELDAWWTSRGVHLREAVSSDSLPSIVVLPFANLSPDRENEYFSDGLADDIIDALTKLPGLRVIARTSAFAFKGKDIDVSEIGAKLKVGTVLEGSVRRTGSRIRISAQLIRVADQSHLWSEHYDREITDVFAIQDEISRAMVEKLRVHLATDRPLVKRHTENLEAYNLFLRGRYCLLRVTPESFAKGKEYLEHALALDPNYALAHTGLAEYYRTSAFWGVMRGSETIPRAKAAALAALKADDTLAEAHAMFGAAKGAGDFKWVEAEQEFRRALELNPASPTVHFYYEADCLRPTGRLHDALSEVRQVVELDPLSGRYNACLGYLYDLSGQHDLAVEQAKCATDLDPNMYMPRFILATAYGHMGRFEEAIAEAHKACDLCGRNSRSLGLLAWLYGMAGQRGESRTLLGELTTRRRTAYVPPSAMALVYRGLGEVDQVLEWLEKGIEERDLMIISNIKCEPLFVERRHPRYHALLRKMNLEG